ncbi:hypothetical protein [Cupriavidus agavae]|uniref:ANTAR domain-containing protein n=1 Tax=Cupriavidus agavae TaxID=1001822 RepID=A0A4Q7S8Q3_9BURK|nr:hypothetical protein [Cupriavidus agavae]RZT42836.1 hypothetical protein EV147_1880 [Cupriavidus agavae]
MEHPSYEEGRLAAIAVRLAMSSGLPPAKARAALEMACRMIDDTVADTARHAAADRRPSPPVLRRHAATSFPGLPDNTP